jgi:ATP-dependent Clp protease protease subunit
MTEKPPLFGRQLREDLFRKRVLVLDGALDDDNGAVLMTQLLTLGSDSDDDIALWIHSPGGSVPAMLAIRDVMRLIPNDVSTLAMGWAASAGQFLLSSGTRGKRYALEHARVLLHQGSAGIGGSAVDVELQADELRETRDTVLALIAADTGQPVDKVRADSLRDRWFSAPQALAYGFVDAVVSDLASVRPTSAAAGGFVA